MRKSWSTVFNSPGALCRISSSVAGLIPGERTSATPRSVLQISDRHLRRYPIRIAGKIATIFNESLRSGDLPTKFKTGHVIPLLKPAKTDTTGAPEGFLHWYGKTVAGVRGSSPGNFLKFTEAQPPKF